MVVTINAQQAVGYNDSWWKPNGRVGAIAQSGNTVYIGGLFTYLGPDNPNWGVVNMSTGLAIPNSLTINGYVSTCISDGSGGFYIGGGFTQISGQPRYRIAHINADGTLNPWDPNANNTVSNLYLFGNKVYAMGSFTNIGGQTRNYIAALDTSTGNATSWNPNPNNSVNSVVGYNGLIYAGGYFTSIGGQTRYYISALDTINGNATAWAPNADNYINSIVINNSVLYLGGSFSTFAGQNRNRLAAYDLGANSITTWDPNANNTVYNLLVIGNKVYAAGYFTNIGGQNRNYLASLDIITGNATSWNHNPNTVVNSLVGINNLIYAIGTFTTIDGQNRYKIAAFDTATGALTSWNPPAMIMGTYNNPITTCSVIGNTMYLGGSFKTIGGYNRKNIAAYDITTGLPTNWNPGANKEILTIGLKGNNVYVGGYFDTIAGVNRNRIAVVDSATGVATSWNPNANSSINTLAISGNTVYAGGYFSTIGGQIRGNIASIDVSTGNINPWNPSADNVVNCITSRGGVVYVGGNFDYIGGNLRHKIAALDSSTGNATSWNPNADAQLNTIVLNNNIVYAGGNFTNIGGQARNYIAALDTLGTATSWNPNANGNVIYMTIGMGKVYVGGAFFSIGGKPRNRIASLDLIIGNATSWNPNANSSVHAISVSNNTIYAGGYFSSMGGISKRAWFMPLYDSTQLTTPTITSFTPNSGCNGNTITITGSNFTNASQVMIGGINANSFTVNSSTSITAIVGNGESGIVTVSTPSGVAVSTDSFTFSPPAFITASGPTTFCYGSGVQLNANTGPGLSYQWKFWGYNINGATGNSYTASQAGNYTAVVTNSNNCSKTSAAIYVSQLIQPTSTITPSDSAYFCFGNNITLSANNVGSGLSYQWQYYGINLTGFTNSSLTTNSAGSYSVIVTGSNGCSSLSSPTIVSIKPIPTAIITPTGPSTICDGSGLLLVANSGATGFNYQWKINGTNITGATNQTYYTNSAGSFFVKVTDSLNYCSANSSTVNVTVNNLPAVSITQTVDTLYSSGSFSTYQWYFNGSTIIGASNANYIASQTGNYYVIVTDANNCSGQSNTIQFTVGIDEVNGAHLFSVSPNPFKESFVVSCASGNGTIILTDVTGKTLVIKRFDTSTPLSARNLAIDMKGFASGVYLVRYEDGGAIETVKVVKE